MGNIYYQGPNGELYHWSLGKGAGKGEERENHKYVSREWKNGRWNYIYPEDLKKQKSQQTAQKLSNTKYGKQTTNTALRTDTRAIRYTKPEIPANKPMRSKTERTISAVKTAAANSSVAKSAKNYWETQKQNSETLKTNAENLRKMSNRTAGQYAAAKENLQKSKQKGMDEFAKADAELKTAKKTAQMYWDAADKAEKKYNRNPATIAKNLSELGEDIQDTVKDISNSVVSSLKKAANKGRDYIKDILGYDERERYEKAQKDYSNASRKDALANQAGMGNRNASSKRVEDAAKNLRDTKEAFENTPLHKLTEASKAVKSGIDYCEKALGGLVTKAKRAVGQAQAKKRMNDAAKTERATMDEILESKRERQQQKLAQKEMPTPEALKTKQEGKKAVDEKRKNVEKTKAQRKLSTALDDLNDLINLRNEVQKDADAAAKEMEAAISKGDEKARNAALAKSNDLRRQLASIRNDVQDAEAEFDELSDSYASSYNDYEDLLEEERKRLGVGTR